MKASDNPGQQRFLNAGPDSDELRDYVEDEAGEYDGKTKIHDPLMYSARGGGAPHMVDVNKTQQATKAMAMRVAGATYAEIADKCGYKTPQGASAAVQYMLRAMAREPAKGVLRLELARTDALLAAWWPFAVTNETVDANGEIHQSMPDPQAALVVLKIMERRDKLYGFNDKTAPAMPKEEGDDRGKPIEQLSEPARVTRLEQILDAARARRDRQDSS